MTDIDSNGPSDGPTAMPILHTERLEIRPIRSGDLADCRQIYRDIGWADSDRSDADNLARRRSWVDWSIANERELGRLAQPPMGERTVIDRAGGAFVGLVGLNPALGPFGQLPMFGGVENARSTLEVGLFWAITPLRQGQGLATEAAQALIDYMFDVRRLARVVATTEHDNHASIAVMRRLGMRVEANPWPDPFHFQTVGVLDAGDRP
ncbi:MAG TPA: GNAT family N-acetyltransferase [Caulobacteraceae bacterium]|nr:GNAT family N-acetyltransferase [Caulobacteraceae bacterium]